MAENYLKNCFQKWFIGGLFSTNVMTPPVNKTKSSKVVQNGLNVCTNFTVSSREP